MNTKDLRKAETQVYLSLEVNALLSTVYIQVLEERSICRQNYFLYLHKLV